MNDATVTIKVRCPFCAGSWNFSPEEFIQNSKQEGFRWYCNDCQQHFNVYHVKNLRPELWT